MVELGSNAVLWLRKDYLQSKEILPLDNLSTYIQKRKKKNSSNFKNVQKW